MKIIYPYFQNSETDYARLCNVFEKSARRYMPDAELVCIELEAAQPDEDKHDLTTRAFLSKIRALDKEPEGLYVVADCDLFFTGNVRQEIEDLKPSFVGITERAGYKYRWNTGIFFVDKKEKRLPHFIVQWAQETQYLWMRKSSKETKSEIKKHGGIDQAALDRVFALRKTPVVIYPTWAYNACQSDWPQTNVYTKVYHIKSGLRKIVLDPKKEHGELYLKAHARVQEIARMWWAEEDR